MKVVGIDLAGNPKNPTGFCILSVGENKKIAMAKILRSDEEILGELKKSDAGLVAIDAPLTFKGENRMCDDELRIYGALPPTLRGMTKLAERGTKLAGKLKKLNFEVIEVFPTASAKILGFYDKKEIVMQKRLISAGIGGLEDRILKKDELDAVFAALTVHLEKGTEEVGDEEGVIIVPKV